MTRIGCVTTILILSLALVVPVFSQSAPADSLGAMFSLLYSDFDQPVDPDRYLIRPGDQLRIIFIRSQVRTMTLGVDPEGRVIDGTLGVFDLTGLTLARARSLLLPELNRLYKADDITISITEPRPVSIVVSGAVANPGAYVAYTSQRVSDVIQSAGGILDNGSRRWIVLSGGPEPIRVDLDRALYLGDQAANPRLYAGTHIFVPGKATELVQVVGEVNHPRDVELIEGDNLNDILLLAGGVRFGADRQEVQIINPGGNVTSDPNSIEPGAMIWVPSVEISKDHQWITIFGAIHKPGTYRARENMTMADAIDLAGGYTEHANSASVTVFRKARFDEFGRASDLRYPISHRVNDQADGQAILLEPADSLYVPLRLGYVRVSGEVFNPGLFPHREGEDAQYYIQAAGGFTPRAEEERIGLYNRVSRVTMPASPETRVNDGDEIIVAVREELK